MKKLHDFKFCSGISEDNLKKEIKKLEDEGHDVFKPEFDFLNDRFILFFNKRDITQPTKEDLSRFSGGVEVTPEIQNSRTTQQRITDYAKQYWFVTLGIVAVIFYYLFVYRG